MPEQHQSSEIAELRSRLARLEAAAARPRGRTNLPGAARYLGISEETLRRKHSQGDAPPRTRVGSRNWSYSYADIDAWVAAQASDAA
jgi:predicted DNA-binding transcriptional regulator AlpA